MYKIDLNCDLGESFGNYKIESDEKIIPLISSANVACGYHAGDPLVMKKTVELVKKNKISIGAHPGFPDLMGFGRREMKVSYDEVKSYVLYQLGALDAFNRAQGLKMQHVKPHGALYNISKAICEAISEFNPNLILLGLSGSETLDMAKKVGLRYASEVFADRAYEEDGSLVSRDKEGSMIYDENEAISRVIRMIKEKKIKTITGKDIDIKVDSICVHGDGKKALLFVEKIRKSLEDEKICIKPLNEIIK
mgnify:FL=1